MNSAQRHYYLQQLGVVQYVSKQAVLVEDNEVVNATLVEDAVSSAAPQSSLVSPDAAISWPQLEQQMSQCSACEMHKTRANVVLGKGDKTARLLIVGEAPSAEEDKQGEPFVGTSENLFNAMLWAMGFSREQVFITNTIKCKPSGERKAGVKEIAACRGYLMEQINLIQPHLILAVGAVAAHSLLETDQAVGKLRGKVHKLGEQRTPVLVTYHPAYLLRRPEEKAKSWADLQLALKTLNVA